MDGPLHFAGTRRYRPLRLLGRGGMGAVYEVEDTETGDRVALKLIVEPDAWRLLRFKQEFRVASGIRHPNLIRLFDLDAESDRWFFTMELVEGQALREALGVRPRPAGLRAQSTIHLGDTAPAPMPGAQTRPAPAPAEAACELGAFTSAIGQLLDALECLHGHGIVHRDLKPSNVLVDGGGRVRLLDFGLADRPDRSQIISRTGSVLGTIAYMAPEQIEADAFTPATDLYALGCVMFELLAGELPLTGQPARIFSERLHRPPPRVDERVRGVPPAIVEICAALMAREPSARPSIEAVRAALGLAPGRPLRPRRAPFVGRRQELGRLEERLDRAEEGRLQFALISGASGVGKSALAAELIARARGRGFLCLRGRCYERERLPFAAFDSAIDALALAMSRWPSDRLAPLRPAIRRLLPVFPTLGVLGEPEGDGPEDAVDPRGRHRLALDGFCELVARCQAHAPLLFALDDLQWAGVESVALLEALLAGAPGRVLVMGVARPEPAPRFDRLRQLAATHLPLGPLPAEESARLFESAAGGAFDAATVSKLVERTGGSPLMATLFIDRLAALDPSAREAFLDAAKGSGSAVEALLQALSPDAALALSFAAVAGGGISTALLGAASGLSSEALERAVAELTRARMLRELPARVAPAGRGAPSPGRRVDVYHDQIRERVYARADPAQRRSVHRALAVALEAASGDPEALSRHWGAAGDRERRRRYALEAAFRASAKLAFGRAASHLTLIQADPPPGEPALDTATRWERVGTFYDWSGQLARATDAYERAIALWEDAPARPERQVALLRLRGLIGRSLIASGRVHESWSAFDEGARMMGFSLRRALPGQLLALASAALHRALCAALPARLVRRAPTDWDRERMRFLSFAQPAVAYWPLLARSVVLRNQALAIRFDDRDLQFYGLTYGTLVRLFLGRLGAGERARAGEELDRAEVLAQHRSPASLEIVRLYRSLLWIPTDLARAQSTNEAARAGLERWGLADDHDGSIGLVVYFWILLMRGDPEALVEAALRTRRRPHLHNACRLSALVGVVIASIRMGRVDAAAAAMERLRAACEEGDSDNLSNWIAWPECALAVAQGRAEAALQLSDARWRRAHAEGRFVIGFSKECWWETLLDAELALHRRGALSRRQTSRARRRARWLSRQETFGSDCMGHRALALLADRPARARAAIQRALERSATHGGAWRRWRCLEAARALGALNLELEAEASALAGSHGFAPPSPRAH